MVTNYKYTHYYTITVYKYVNRKPKLGDKL